LCNEKYTVLNEFDGMSDETGVDGQITRLERTHARQQQCPCDSDTLRYVTSRDASDDHTQLDRTFTEA